MYDNVLFIVGNGFDLHHEVKSSFYEFRDYLKKHDYKLFDQYERYCNYNNLWSNFETSLAFISRDMALALGEPLIPPTNKGDNDLQIADILMAGDFVGGAESSSLDLKCSCLKKSLMIGLHPGKKNIEKFTQIKKERYSIGVTFLIRCFSVVEACCLNMKCCRILLMITIMKQRKIQLR